ncbi:MAG: sugar ABC transporter permease [Psychrilyobacter sp.]|nr:sugar ABC transporter permease [Psychrilyobacter sp.]
MQNRNIAGWLFISPYMIFFMIFLLIPTISGVALSFTDYTGYSLDNLSFIGLENYKVIFNPSTLYFKEFWGAVLRTIGYVVISVPLVVGIPLVLASMINELSEKAGNIFRVIFYIPTLFSVAAIGLLGVWFFEQQYGLVNYFLDVLGFAKIGWVNNEISSWIAILLLTIWWTIGGNLIIFLASLKEIPKGLYEAAEIDGANTLQKFIYITIPGLKNQILFTVIMAIIASFNLYGQPSILTGGGPGRATTTATMYIREVGFGASGTAGLAAAMAIIFGMIIMVVSYFQFKLQTKED